MQLIINKKTSVSDVQQAFNNHFKYLRLEFFSFQEGSKIVFSKKNMITNTEQLIGDIGLKGKNGIISLNGNQKAGTLEANFLKEYGLYVQVFRKSGKNWLETSSSDAWTLAQQNKAGSQKSAEKVSTTVEFDSYHEQL